MKKRMLVFAMLGCLLLCSSLSVEGQEKAVEKNQALPLEEVIEGIDPSIYGGVYYDESGNLILNVKETGAACVYPDFVTVRYVTYSLQELENMKTLLEPYRIKYGLVTLDANEATNTVDVEVYEENEEIWNLIASIPGIDASIVRISELGDYSIRLTTTAEPET